MKKSSTLGCVAIALASAFWASLSEAQKTADAEKPAAFVNRQALTGFDLERKKTGRYVVGLPLANFDPSTGIGFGARAYVYWNGEKDDKLFGYVPYEKRIFLQVFRTTKGLSFHWVDFDMPVLWEGRMRLRAQAFYARNTQQHFFGLGDTGAGDINVTGLGSFQNFSDMDNAINRIGSNGQTQSHYNFYDFTKPVGLASLETSFFGGLVRLLTGVAVVHNGIDDYTGEEVDVRIDGEIERAVSDTTRLEETCQAGLLIGCDGGWDNFLRFGLVYDTRDYEPDPNSGVFVEAAVDLATSVVGSDYNYARFMVSGRGYYSPFPELADLVLATRGTIQMHSDGAPFFTQSIFPFTEDPRTGLGGHRTLRGFRQDRFVGRATGLLNVELRYTATRFNLGSQEFGLILIPFYDVGRAFDSPSDYSFDNWRWGAGMAVRLAWNQATLISVDYGLSDEDSGLYINFAHMF